MLKFKIQWRESIKGYIRKDLGNCAEEFIFSLVGDGKPLEKIQQESDMT